MMVRRLLWIAISGIGIIFLGYICLFRLPMFTVTDITYSGNQFITDDDVVSFLVPYLDNNRFELLFLSSFRSSLKRRFFSVESTSVTLKRNGIIHLTIQEKRPWISFIVEGQYYVVARDGTVLNWNSEWSSSGTNQTLMVIHGLDSFAFVDGRMDDAVRETVSDLVGMMQRYFDGLDIQIAFERNRDVVLFLNDSLPVYFGNNGDAMEAQCELLRDFLDSEYSEESYRYLDVRIKDRLYAAQN